MATSARVRQASMSTGCATGGDGTSAAGRARPTARAGGRNALSSVVLELDGEAVGCARIVGDGGVYFYLQDVIVLPEHQGRGQGARLMDALLGALEGSARPGAFIGLMAAGRGQPLYER